MKLFEEAPRDFSGPQGMAETDYSFLNRSSSIEALRVRGLLENWFQIFPDSDGGDAKAHLLKGFRDTRNNKNVIAAFFELYCHAWLYYQGYECDVCSPSDTRTRKFDFYVKRNGTGIFLMECTTVGGLPSQSYARLIDGYRIRDSLHNYLYSPDYFLMVTINKEGASPPSRTAIKRDVHEWLKTLNYHQVRNDYDSSRGLQENQRKRASERVFKFGENEDEWVFTFTPIPKNDMRGKGNIKSIGVWSPKVRWEAFTKNLRTRLEKKAGYYGDLTLPLVIAVSGNDGWGDMQDLEDVLCGMIEQMEPSGSSTFELDNFWYSGCKPRNRKVSAVLGIDYVSPFSVAYKTPILWINHNRWADYPFQAPLWKGPKRVLIPQLTNKVLPLEVKPVRGKKASTIFSLNEKWPEKL